MVQALNIIPKAPFVASQLGLNPATHPGTVEIIDGIQRVFFASQKPGMSSENFLEGLRNVQGYWKFQVDTIREFAPQILVADTLDPMIGAVLGGIDIAALAKTRPETFWKTEGAQKATFITLQSSGIETPEGFAASRIDVKFVIMVNTLCDLCTQSSLMDTYPERFRQTPLAEIEGMGVCDKLALPENPLTNAIRETEQGVTAKWRNLYVPPKKKHQPPRLTVVN